jgi:hypothetical protein
MKTTLRSLGIRYCDICAGARFLLVSMTVLWPSGAIGQQMSLKCIYEIMTSIRESMVLCGDPLDRKSEETYHELRASLKRFINENAKYDEQRIAPDYDQIHGLSAREGVAKGFCKLPEYPIWKEWLQEFLQKEATIRKRLETPGSPTEGDCL